MGVEPRGFGMEDAHEQLHITQAMEADHLATEAWVEAEHVDDVSFILLAASPSFVAKNQAILESICSLGGYDDPLPYAPHRHVT